MPGLLDPDTLAGLDHATLYRMRMSAPPELQGLLAGYEHQAFARELVADKPWMAASLAVASPMYQLSKFLPGNESRSAPSWSQLGQEYRGIGQGLLGAYQSLTK